VQVAPAVPHIITVWLGEAWQTLLSQQPVGQEVPSHTHVPPKQRCPEAQAVPQVPQLAPSVCLSTQAFPHKDSVEGQAQWPLWQVIVPEQGPQAVPALPHDVFVWAV
jgi:hypothetical protein